MWGSYETRKLTSCSDIQHLFQNAGYRPRPLVNPIFQEDASPYVVKRFPGQDSSDIKKKKKKIE